MSSHRSQLMMFKSIWPEKWPKWCSCRFCSKAWWEWVPCVLLVGHWAAIDVKWRSFRFHAAPMRTFHKNSDYLRAHFPSSSAHDTMLMTNKTLMRRNEVAFSLDGTRSKVQCCDQSEIDNGNHLEHPAFSTALLDDFSVYSLSSASCFHQRQYDHHDHESQAYFE